MSVIKFQNEFSFALFLSLSIYLSIYLSIFLSIDLSLWLLSAVLCAGGTADVIKTHHNDTQLVRDLREAGRIIEPLADYHVRFTIINNIIPYDCNLFNYSVSGRMLLWGKYVDVMICGLYTACWHIIEPLVDYCTMCILRILFHAWCGILGAERFHLFQSQVR